MLNTVSYRGPGDCCGCPYISNLTAPGALGLGFVPAPVPVLTGYYYS